MEDLDIFHSVKSEAIKDIVPEILEATLDSLTDSETLKDIPIEKREKFITQLNNKENANKAGEKLLITLNRLNDIEKAKIIGKLFKHTILEKMKFEDFNRLSHIIDNSYISDINLLKDNIYLNNIEQDIKSNLSQTGLLTQTISNIFEEQAYRDRIGVRGKVKPKFIYSANRYCKLLIEFGFE